MLAYYAVSTWVSKSTFNVFTRLWSKRSQILNSITSSFAASIWDFSEKQYQRIPILSKYWTLSKPLQKNPHRTYIVPFLLTIKPQPITITNLVENSGRILLEINQIVSSKFVKYKIHEFAFRFNYLVLKQFVKWTKTIAIFTFFLWTNICPAVACSAFSKF
jgi:hypothetical protein